jgi:hypothetical protein
MPIKEQKNRPIWKTVNGKIVPYDELVLPKGQLVYAGGTIPRRTKHDIVFPNPLDVGERGFGVDQDIFQENS